MEAVFTCAEGKRRSQERRGPKENMTLRNESGCPGAGLVAQQGKKLKGNGLIDERKTDTVHTDRLVHTDHSGKKGRRRDEQKLERLMSQGMGLW